MQPKNRHRLSAWCYKWLPRIFGCHCRDDRSFHWKGEKFPICARCTGMLTGILFFVCTAWFRMPELPVAVLMLVPLIADGIIQLKTPYESKNIRRAWTGFLFGYGLLAAQVQSMLCSFRFGYGLTH